MFRVDTFALFSFIAAKGLWHLLLRCKPIKESISDSNEEEKDLIRSRDEGDRKIQILKQEIKKLRDVITQKEKDSQEIQKYTELLSELYDRGVIDTQRKILDTEI